MRIGWIWGWVGLIAGCGGAAERVATEDIGAADVRIVVARSGEMAEARALADDAPYRFELEPLGDVFARGDTLRVWVLGYRADALGAAFPRLAGRGAADIIDRLQPALGPIGPGRFEAPTPETVLFAQIDDKSPADVGYATRGWSEVKEELGLHLVLPGELACPPVGAVLRAFSRDEPGRVCIYTRDEKCEWGRSDNSPCPNQGRIFGAEGAIVEQPDGSLRLGDTRCTPTEARDGEDALGETAAFSCDGRLVAVQEQPRDALGALWAPSRGTAIANDEVARGGRWVPVSPGVYYAFERDGAVSLRRIGIDSSETNYEVLQHPVVDAAFSGQRRASSTDGLAVELTGGDFESNVGTAAEQCFRRVDRNLPIASALVTGRAGADGLTLAAPGVAPFDGVLDWQVVGDPGQDFVMSPQVVEVRMPAGTGGLGYLSARDDVFGADLLVHGRDRTFHLPVVTRFAGDERFFSCPREVPRVPDPAGPIIAGPDGYYALVETGVQLIGGDGALGPLLSSEGETFSPSWTITRTLTRRDQERVFVYREGVAHLFDPAGMIHDRITVTGRIVAVLPGPELLYLPEGESFGLHRAEINAGQIASTTTYVVPGFDEAERIPIAVEPAAVHVAAQSRLVGFSSGQLVGVLDLDRGLSVTEPVGAGARVMALFEDDGGSETWGVVTTDMGSVELVHFPKL